MRELTKSMMSYTWAMSMFGVQQMVNLLTPGNGDLWGKAADAFDNVTDATTKTFGGAMTETFKAGESLQQGVIDIIFGGLTEGLNPNRWIRLGRGVAQRTGETTLNTTQAPSPAADVSPGSLGSASASGDWGPMPR